MSLQTGSAARFLPIVGLVVGLGSALALQDAPQGSPLTETARSDSFEFSTRSYVNYSPALLGNGYLFASTAWNGTSASTATLAGLHDHLEENAYAYQALIPAWSEIDYWDGTHWLNEVTSDQTRLEGFAQTLDAYRGVLSTHYIWVDSGRVTRVEAESFVDYLRPYLGVVHIELTPDYGSEVGPVTFSFPLGGGPDQPYLWEGAELPTAIPIRSLRTDADHRGFVAESETRDHRKHVDEAVRIILSPNLPQPQVSLGFFASLNRPALNVKFIVRKGQTYTFTKLVSAASSRVSEPPEPPAEEARVVAAQAERAGFESLREEHSTAWQKLWKTDIVVHGDIEAQRAIHAAMFYLLASLRVDTRWSIPALGLPSRAYLGRVWWDADTFVFPSMLALHLELARSIVAYRCRTLPGARLNAQRLGYGGALFPMESADTGQEEAPEWSGEIHVTGDVAMAQWRYFQATADFEWLRDCGYPVIRDVADFWTSRVRHARIGDQYQIPDVTGPNEAITGVDDDSYTKAVARRTLEVASQAAKLLKEVPNPVWARIAPRILVPFDSARQYHPEHSGAAEGQFAHALILLTYPLDLPTSNPIRRNDLDACLKNFGKPGYDVGMLGNFYSIVASELGDQRLGYKLFSSGLHSHTKPQFYTMTETPTNGRAVFLTAEGAFLQKVIFGFTGLRFTDDGLARVYQPLLPPTWDSLDIRRLAIRGKLYDVHVAGGNKLSLVPAGEQPSAFAELAIGCENCHGPAAAVSSDATLVDRASEAKLVSRVGDGAAGSEWRRPICAFLDARL